MLPLAEHFAAIDAFLIAHQEVWRPRPFVCQEPLWSRRHPELHAWLSAQPLACAEQFQQTPWALTAPAPFSDWAEQAQRLTTIAALPRTPTVAPTALSVDVPGRKWEQIQALAASIDFEQPVQHWLDWCAGKGYLGRLLAADGSRLTCVEWDETLVAAGAALSQRHAIQASHQQLDVMSEGAIQHVQPQQTPVALHACGALHIRLLRLAVTQGCRQLAIAPCCYNRISTPFYEPLSQQAQRSQLRLDAEDLRLPISETVTAGQRVRRQRDQSMAWRLGFDELQRRIRQCDEYLPMPSVSAAWLAKPFADYCRDLGALRQLAIPQDQDWIAVENSGWRRLAMVRNLELVRGLFRRPLELWLVFDAALWLEEQGYRVRLGTFCPTSLTPRNLLILAERSA